MRKQSFTIPLAAAAIFCSSLFHATEVYSTENIAAVSAYTKLFIEKATIENKFVLETSELALKKSANPEIKAFAEKVIDDHKQILGRLKLAASESSTADLMPESLDQTHQDLIEQLKNSTSPASFDQLYLEIQNNTHTEALYLFLEYSENGDNIFLKEFALDAVPALESHKRHINSLLQNQ